MHMMTGRGGNLKICDELARRRLRILVFIQRDKAHTSFPRLKRNYTRSLKVIGVQIIQYAPYILIYLAHVIDKIFNISSW